MQPVVPVEDVPAWKQVSQTAYEVSDQGQVRRNGRIITPIKDESGYLNVKLHGGGHQPKMVRIHRLVAAAYLHNPENKPYVNHIDGDRTNNALGNLEWVTPVENRARLTRPWRLERGRPIIQRTLEGNTLRRWGSIKEASEALGTPTSNIGSACRSSTRTAAGFRWAYEDATQEPEEWKTIEYKGAEFAVSSLGRVSTRYGPSYGSRSDRSYYVFRGELVHRLVAVAFCPRGDESQTVVNHLDSNQTNNRASNLEWATPSENLLHGYRVGKGKRLCKPVRQTLSDGSSVEYPSAVEASRATGINKTSISRVCKGAAKSAGGCRWEYAGVQNEPSPQIADDDPIWGELGL